ncbi:MAG: TRAM domain-containing protein [Vicinamibacteraceae bacterium]
MAALPADPIELTIERPVAGGRMLARHDGRVILVAGAIPGETVRARIDRVERGVAFARVEAVLEASPDRRPPIFDPACGGGVYAHIDPARQVVLKRDVILDGLRRGAGLAWDGPLVVAPSPERGYRLRARLHVRDGRVGFFKEGTHALCDAAPSAQLDERALDAAQRLVDTLGAVLGAASTDGVDVSENLDGTERAVHLHPIDRALVTTAMPASLSARLLVDGLTGVSVATAGAGSSTIAGDPVVADDLSRIVRGAPSGIRMRRHAASFFQGNRFLVGALTQAVIDAVPGDGPVWDLYAGVGLFAVSLGAIGRARITAVEGDPLSAADLEANAAACGGRVGVEARAVEDVLAAASLPADATVIVDPPRTGLSPAVTTTLARSAVRRIVYVSCDVATLARDLKAFMAAGFAVVSLEGFDLFPNTAHVETLVVLAR